jgi:hypothetical protein
VVTATRRAQACADSTIGIVATSEPPPAGRAAPWSSTEAGAPPPADSDTWDRTAWLPWLRWWADLLDSRFRIPGTRVRFGIDPILSLVPGLGDLASPTFTAALLAQVVRQRVPRIVVLRMLANAFVDAVLGVIPVAGQIGDLFWRANLRNLALLERHADPSREPERSDYLFVFAVAAAFGLVLAIPVVAAVWVAILLWRMLQ